jgi:hypothetical protein
MKVHRRGTTNGWRWRVVDDNGTPRSQIMLPAQGFCVVGGKSHATVEAAVRAVKADATRRGPAPR